ncbi:het domain-containing protein [Colletotrichum asianum]|uniref:Het domain-containing protein n=1 Tax=Colletotrichum asianum TaxID=702518 RepID=A0A8H3WEE6_9PEZI|nr:het domain-containing protein [Colletotrichum asianum]
MSSSRPNPHASFQLPDHIRRHVNPFYGRRSNGCETCGFTPESASDLRREHGLRTWTDASLYCNFCHLIVALHDDLKTKHAIAFADLDKGKIAVYSRNARDGRKQFLLGPNMPDMNMPPAERETIFFYNFPDSRFPWEGIPYDRDMSDTAGSEECLLLLKHWVEECQTSHTDCSPSDHPLPTRVLDVTANPPKLVITANLSQKDERYIALSHCWGLSQPLRTLKTNIGLHQDGIDLSSTPQTFKDAVAVTRYLGMRYIWIDSLCIVQDDVLDWEYEAARMGDVYGFAYLVLGASSASDGAKGFLGRRTQVRGSVTVSCSASPRKFSKIHYRPVLDHSKALFSANFDGPLSERGWAFQERALAKRFVSFGEFELQWACRSLEDCECDELDLRKSQVGIEGNNSWRFRGSVGIHAKGDGMSTQDAHYFHRQWRKSVVTPYSGRKLTFQADKLVALSAISRVFQERVDDEFLAGLWRRELVHDLSWNRSRVEESRGCIGAPSWSWASINGAVSWWKSSFVESLRHTEPCKVIEAECTAAFEVNPFGSVESGYVILEGLVIKATAKYLHDPPPSQEGRHYFLTEWPAGEFYADSFLGTADVELNGEVVRTAVRGTPASAHYRQEVVEYPVWCFLLTTGYFGRIENYEKYAYVLVLGRSVSRPRAFERVGLMVLKLGKESLPSFLSPGFFSNWRNWRNERVTIM